MLIEYAFSTTARFFRAPVEFRQARDGGVARSQEHLQRHILRFRTQDGSPYPAIGC